MKKFIYIVASFLVSFSLVACMPQGMPDEDDSLPEIDIVERSQLLDMVTIDHIFGEKDKQLMADMGVTVSFDDFELTADDMAKFRLCFTKGTDTFNYTAEAAIDYIAMADGSFEDIRFYWGGLTKAGDNLMVTSLYDYAVLPLDGQTTDFIPVQLDFIRENNGYVVHTAYGFGRYAVMYYTADRAGIAVFDKNGNLISDKTETIGHEGVTNMLCTHTYGLVADVPFSYKDNFGGFFVSKDLFMIDHNWIYEGNAIETYRIYNCQDSSVSQGTHKTADAVIKDGIIYSNHEIFVPGGGDVDVGYSGIALRQEKGEYTGCVVYDTKGYSYEKQSSGTLSVDDNGRMVYHSQPTGLQFTIDFENSSCEKEYNITQDMLGEKIATSKDKKYSLYEYSKHAHNSQWVSYLALKNETTGHITFVSDYKGFAYREHILDAGFFSNGDVWLMTDYDFAIYLPEDTEKGPVFNIGEKFPLGIDGPQSRKYNTLWAVRRDPVDKTFIVVYDHIHHESFYTPPLAENENFCDDTYDVALLDKNGNIIKNFTTEMAVPANTNVLNISLSGDVLTMENLARDTGKTIQKATLNIKTGDYRKIL